jgi:hypothetical protein
MHGCFCESYILPRVGSYKESGVISISEGVTIYSSRPRDGQESKAVLLFYPDAFGLAIHNRILADKYAAFGKL